MHWRLCSSLTAILCTASALTLRGDTSVGREVAIARHLQDGEEFSIPLRELLDYGRRLFQANFTSEEGAGRPLTKGTGAFLSDLGSPLRFPRNTNRISGPDANSCAGCHNQPVVGGFGDFATNVFVLAQRFDFADFDARDTTTTRGAANERGRVESIQSIANSRATTDMFGSGFYEMLARQITADLRTIRDGIRPGRHSELISKGISFGVLARSSEGTWDTSRVTGLPSTSVTSTGPTHPPSLLVQPFHQSGSVVSLRQFTTNSFNQHLGLQATERFGIDTDPDGDGVVNELTRADITACSLFQAALPVPTKTVSADPEIRAAVMQGGTLFREIGCASCHVPSLPLDRNGWIYTEPNPYNPPGNLRSNEAPTFSLDLSSDELPLPRLRPENGVVMVPLYTDFKLHDICRGPGDPNREPLNQNEPAGSRAFFAGNERFLTRRLWAVGSKPNYFHHGQFTTIRQAILNHYGEANDTRLAFIACDRKGQDEVIEFLRSLQAPTMVQLAGANAKGR